MKKGSETKESATKEFKELFTGMATAKRKESEDRNDHDRSFAKIEPWESGRPAGVPLSQAP